MNEVRATMAARVRDEPGAVKRRLAAIMAADVVGYSRLMGKDEEGTLRQVKALLQEVARPYAIEHRGRIVKTMGDGFLAQFSSVIEAFHCAVKLQQAASERNAGVPPERQIVLRIGINVGDIIFERGDVFGDGVNIAARLESLAKPGGICVSGRAWEDLRQLQLPFKDMGELRLKNIAQPVRAYGLTPSSPETPPPAKPALGVATTAAAGPRRLWLAVATVAALAGVAAGWLLLTRAPESPTPTAAQLVAAEIDGLPCSWLRVSDHSSVDGVEVYKLSGSSATEPALLSQTVQRALSGQGLKVSQVIASDVAPLNGGQCAWINKLKGFRYTGIPRFSLDVRPVRKGLTRAAITVKPAELGPEGVIYGVEPSGAVQRIIDSTQLVHTPVAKANADGSYTLNLDIDHKGWNGIVFMESRTPVPEGFVERPLRSDADRTAFETMARAGGWRFELAWFRAGS